MMELKTLKDFENEAHSFNSDEMGLNAYLINPVELKAEAVKWVKEIIKEQERRGRWIKGSKCNQSQISPRKQGQMSFIKRFFNLTEEDLK